LRSNREMTIKAIHELNHRDTENIEESKTYLFEAYPLRSGASPRGKKITTKRAKDTKRTRVLRRFEPTTRVITA